MSMIDAIPLLAGAGADGYQISRSVRLRSSASAYFNRTPAGVGNQQKFTWSAWLKRGSLGTLMQLFSAGTTSPVTNFAFYLNASGGGASAVDALELYSQAASTANGYYTSQQVLRDPSAWYHIVLSVDTTQATAGNRVSVWVNNQIVTLTGVTVFAQNTNTVVNSVTPHKIAASVANSQTVDGYLTEINFIDGQALTPSSFGETNSVTGVWQPKRYAGTYGTNGFYLNFSDNSGVTATTIGKDYSGSGNNWTPNNISITAGATYDSMLDVPTPYADGGNGRGNYAVLNPLLSAGGTTANGNLQVTTATGVGHSRATIAMPASGKWYCEFTAVSAATATDYIFGIVGADTAEASYGYNQTPSYSYTAFGERVVNGTFTASFYSSYTTNDVIGCAVNLDANEITWYKNGVAQTAISITNGSYFWIVSDSSGTRQITAAFNAGQRPFTYTPPTGFVALNTQNLPTPTISNGAAYMAATTYTGNGTTQSISNAVNGVSFQPDFVWFKNRTGANNHALYDSVRGRALGLISNATNAEQSASAGNDLVSFDSNGVSLGPVEDFTSVNGSAQSIVAWQWNAGGSTVTNTSGTISAQVRANATAGFSVVTYTGTGANATVGHGLGVAPRMIIIKKRSTTGNWSVYHANLTSYTYSLYLNVTNAQASDPNTRGSAPSSSTFSVGTDSDVNASTATYVAYCFAAVAGYSAFGSYTGNGSTDGPFVFLGFRPRFVMWKRTDTTGDWVIQDTTRGPYNQTPNYLIANTSGAEGAPPLLDINSNGFKIRINDVGTNASGGTYIFMAVAENPFKLSLAR